MDYVHQVSFNPSSKGYGAGKQVIDKIPFELIVLIEVEIMAKIIKKEVIDLGDSIDLTMLLILAGEFLMGSPKVKNIAI